MGILDALKNAAVETFKTVAEEALKNAAASSSNTQAASNKAENLVGSKAAPNEQSGPAQKELSRAEVEAIIDARAKAKNMRSNWRNSIVDLMTALDMNSSLNSRKALAAKLNYYGYAADDSAEKNMWLHAELLRVLAKNRGDVPWELMAAVNTSTPAAASTPASAVSTPTPAVSTPVTPTPTTAAPSVNQAVLSSNVAASVRAASLVGSMAAAISAGTTGSVSNSYTAPNSYTAAPNELSRANVEAIIETRVKAKGRPSNWRVSIVDLMSAFDMNSSLDARKVLAAKLNYSGPAADGTAEKNLWLHAELLRILAQNGGDIPSYLR